MTEFKAGMMVKIRGDLSEHEKHSSSVGVIWCRGMNAYLGKSYEIMQVHHDGAITLTCGYFWDPTWVEIPRKCRLNRGRK